MITHVMGTPDIPTHPHQERGSQNQRKTSPREVQYHTKRGWGKGFVKISAGISEVGIQFVQKVPSAMWERMLICFEREVIEELFTRAQAL
jgi:hypothetical protein